MGPHQGKVLVFEAAGRSNDAALEMNKATGPAEALEKIQVFK